MLGANWECFTNTYHESEMFYCPKSVEESFLFIKIVSHKVVIPLLTDPPISRDHMKIQEICFHFMYQLGRVHIGLGGQKVRIVLSWLDGALSPISSLFLLLLMRGDGDSYQSPEGSHGWLLAVILWRWIVRNTVFKWDLAEATECV